MSGNYFSNEAKSYTEISMALDNDMLEKEAVSRTNTFFRQRLKNNITGLVDNYIEGHCFQVYSDLNQRRYFNEEYKDRANTISDAKD
mmetsp:Transcript_36389/g.55864  ORF Transcript_36389/g.55864 Transcript_36389/m.55864 type:complete len:87 (+) Transcript_36389:596-856(+)